MDRDNLLKWIVDLETTTEPQARSCLFDGVGYCCLGRLCVVAGEEFAYIDETGEHIVFDYDGLECSAYPPERVLSEFLDDEEFDYTRYASLNDKDELTFSEIAQVLRQDHGFPDS